MRRTFPATLDGLQACQEFLSTIYEDPKPQIITDEIVSNIVRCSGSPDFAVEFIPEADTLRMVYIDKGVPFDPTAQAEPDITKPAAERDIGGLGLFMVKKMAQSVTYERKDGANILTVIIKR